MGLYGVVAGQADGMILSGEEASETHSSPAEVEEHRLLLEREELREAMWPLSGMLSVADRVPLTRIASTRFASLNFLDNRWHVH